MPKPIRVAIKIKDGSIYEIISDHPQSVEITVVDFDQQDDFVEELQKTKTEIAWEKLETQLQFQLNF